MAEERAKLRAIFDEAALLYDEVRPGYPEELFDDIVALSGIPSGGRILEIGCGTGQATVPFARRGYRILCVELGKNLAAVARRNLETYPRAEVHVGPFEEWQPQKAPFDLAVSATAFHWLDPEVAYPRAADALRKGGSLALFWNVHVDTDADSGFFEEAQRIYEREASEIVGPELGPVRGKGDKKLPLGRNVRRGGLPARVEDLLGPQRPQQPHPRTSLPRHRRPH